MYSAATAGAVASPVKPLLLTTELARDDEDVRLSQRLRHRVFAEEMGARLDCPDAGMDVDRFDPHCHHLLVRNAETGEVLGSTRILLQREVRKTGGFYSETEFDLGRILTCTKSFMEIGRTCVHPDYRSGAVIGMLWAGIAGFMNANQVDYLMGCASIPLDLGADHVHAIMAELRNKHYAPVTRRAFPKVALPEMQNGHQGRIDMPALLRAYLRVGVEVCGEPHWDRDFNVADVFVLLDRRRINERYLRHFVKGAPGAADTDRAAA
ncbi:MAG: GNAT family N-acetyltransferase [Chromatiales bacterium]|nr:GNAT family N-acetyltransferase [Chromatiales bacterium]